MSLFQFDFLGKDSIRYQNEVEVEPPVFSAIEQFRSGQLIAFSFSVVECIICNYL